MTGAVASLTLTKKVCWDFGDESHFGSSSRCLRRQEPSYKNDCADDKSQWKKKWSSEDKPTGKSDKNPHLYPQYGAF